MFSDKYSRKFENIDLVHHWRVIVTNDNGVLITKTKLASVSLCWKIRRYKTAKIKILSANSTLIS